MTVTVHLPAELAGQLAAVAARRGVGIDEIATELVQAGLARTDVGTGNEESHGRRLAFAGIGASRSGRSASDTDEMLGEGFGRNQEVKS